jgi:PAS domain S-box-containing protein
MLIINAGIKTLALWLIFLWFSRKYLSQPLAIFTKATNNLSLDDLDRGHDLKIDIRTKGRNELKVLEETFNSMLGKLQNALKKRKEVEGELRESEEKYRTLFESAPAGIAITTLGGQLLSFNKAFMFLFHYADKQALSRLQLTELLEDPEDFAQLLSELKKEKSLQNYEQNCVDVRGHVFPASLSACFLQYEGHQCLQIILRDISQVKQMESELRNYAHNLQDMVEKKTQELQKANKDLTQALIELEESQEKLSQSAHQAGMAEVAVSVLHNIGNMVTPLNVRTESLKDNAWPQNIRSLQKLRDLFSTGELIFKNKENSQEDSEKLLEYLSTMILMLEKNRDNFYADLQFIKSGLDHISEVIALQQKYAGVSGYETKVDVNALIEDSVEMLRDSIKKREIEVDYDFAELPETTLDRNKMMQIVINLLKNAYEGINEQPGEKKEISIRTELIDKQEEQFIQVKIEDTGVGIDPEHLEEIFNFNYSTKGRGSGFGLHDAANYIQAKYGKIFVHSQGRGQGACVVLQLPLNLINEDRQLENG